MTDPLLRRLSARPVFRPCGRLTEAFGATLRAELRHVAIGEICALRDPATDVRLEAEVIGLSGPSAILAPLGDFTGLTPGALVTPTGRRRCIAVGRGLLGRVIDAQGLPIDGGPAIAGPLETVTLEEEAPDPMSRRMVDTAFPVGMRVIDGLLTCGEGQRVGIFGEPGGGKSTLLGSLVRGAASEVCVVGLIGERGREVHEFVEHTLGPEGMARSVIVAATSDRSAIDREGAALAATRIAEAFRDDGLNVLLVIDSVTRYARALRDIGLAAGEVPTRRGFPSSVFARLPRLLERAGQGAAGSITAFYTVLVEGDGTGDPIAEEVRSILDGHIVLSADLAARGHYPAIDILASKSRVAGAVTPPEHVADAAAFRALWAKHAEIEFLVQVGEYRPGSDALADRALARAEAMRGYLVQGPDTATPYDEARRRLGEIAA